MEKESIKATVEPVKQNKIQFIKDEYGEMIPYLPYVNLNNYTDVFFKFVLRRLTTAINQQRPTANLFYYGPNKLATIPKQKFEEQLTTLIDHYVALEDYESAGKCKVLIEKHKMNP